jgi:hypothetical protein
MTQTPQAVPGPEPTGVKALSATTAFCYIVSKYDGVYVHDRPNVDSTRLAQLQKGNELPATSCVAIAGGTYPGCDDSHDPNHVFWVPVHYDDRNADAYVAFGCVNFYCNPCS